MANVRDALWQELCKSATLELDPAKLHKRIDAAHAVIRRRVDELRSNHDGSPLQEERAVAEALHDLRLLQRVQFISLNGSDQRGSRKHCLGPTI